MPRACVLIRVDASTETGTGHVMRCLVLAEALRERGVACEFLSAEAPGHLCDLVASRGFVQHRMSARPGLSEQVSATSGAAGRTRPLLVVDHYGLDERYESACRGFVEGVVVIDDLADRRHDCDWLVDPNEADRTRYEGLVPERARLLTGTAYALMQRGFAEARSRVRPRTGAVDRILVFYGGSDPVDETPKAIEALRASRYADRHVVVVVGTSNPRRERVRELTRTLPKGEFVCQANDMPALMAAADLSLGAAGVTSWERCCLGLPTLVTEVADNQRGPARILEAAGAAVRLGRSAGLVVEDYVRVLESLREADLAAMSRRALALVDGLGVERVIAKLLA